MDGILARNLRGKSIVGTDGTTVGTLYNITVNCDSGALCELVIAPHSESMTQGAATTDDGRLLIPVSQVITVNDQIVVDAA